VIVLMLLGAVAAAAYWAGLQSRRYPREDLSHQPAARRGAEHEFGGDMPPPRQMTAPTWPWALGLGVIAVVILGLVSGPGGVFGGPGPLFAPVFGP
jgi:hypothetical protein